MGFLLKIKLETSQKNALFRYLSTTVSIFVTNLTDIYLEA